MRIKYIFIIVISLLSSDILVSQNAPTSIPVGWERVYIKDIGFFDLPPTMEIQAGKYKQIQNEAYKQMEYDVPQLVAQQKGLNEFGGESFEKYARVIVETTLGYPGDFENLNFSIARITQEEISGLNTAYNQQIKNTFSGTAIKLIEWYPLRVEKVNGVSCIHISYKRQLQDNPLVLVNMYSFHNNDRMHNLTLSYRIAETEYWKSDFEKILRSFRITNIR